MNSWRMSKPCAAAYSTAACTISLRRRGVRLCGFRVLRRRYARFTSHIRRWCVYHAELERLQIDQFNMTEYWVMLGAGLFLMASGIGMRDVRGAMPGARPGYPPSLRFRLIVISFGAL